MEFRAQSVPMNSASASTTTTLGASQPQEKIFPPLVRQFLDYLRLEKHFSEYTVKSYGADLIQFSQFLAGEIGQLAGAAGSGMSLDDKMVKCEPLTIREFLAYLSAQHNPHTEAGKAAAKVPGSGAGTEAARRARRRRHPERARQGDAGSAVFFGHPCQRARRS
jgi:hypothetical protein